MWIDAAMEFHPDARVRLFHMGMDPYGWEDSGIDRERTASFTLRLPRKPAEGTGGSRGPG